MIITKINMRDSGTLYLEIYKQIHPDTGENCVYCSLETLIVLYIYDYCGGGKVVLVHTDTPNSSYFHIDITERNFESIKKTNVPWQVASCRLPMVQFHNTSITGLCAVARHISKYGVSVPDAELHEEGLLGFRKSCLQAPNEVSVWTKYCEIEILKTVYEIVKQVENSNGVNEIPVSLARFEKHLQKPIRVHNVYKLARSKAKVQNTQLKLPKKLNLKDNTETQVETVKENNEGRNRSKPRKWKSKLQKDSIINSSTPIQDLDLHHTFAEGPFLTLADLVLYPSISMLLHCLGRRATETLPFVHRWHESVKATKRVGVINDFLSRTLELNLNSTLVSKIKLSDELPIPAVEDVSLYKCDPKRSNPKKRVFTKENDVINALNVITDDMMLILSKDFDFFTAKTLNWNNIPDDANPNAGHLPDDRIVRKCEQLENVIVPVMKIAKSGNKIVDFCSGSGHLGILLGHLLPDCTIIMVENKLESLSRARARAENMKLLNVFFFQCNLDFFVGNFDIGVALHACGGATDLVLDKCIKANAKFVLVPCCYGSIHVTDRMEYPRSDKYFNMSVDQYMCIAHAADQTHNNHELAERGARCMAVIDSDRGKLAEENSYVVYFSRLKPLTCTPKNNLLLGIPCKGCDSV